LLIVVNTGLNEYRGTWIHPDVAVNLAQWCSAKFAVAVSRWVRDWLTAGKTPAAPAFHLPTTFAEALRLAADTSEVNEQLKLENAQLVTDLDVKEEQREAAVTEKQEEERKAAAMARAVSLEAESKIWSGWAKEVQAITGVGPRMATKILQAHGILCRHKVEGCSNTDEPAISTRYLDNEWFCYKLQPAVGKTITEDKLDEEGNVIIGPDGKPVQIVVEVLDQDGNQTSVHSRTVKITPKGCPLVMNILTTCNETLLCRLIKLVKIKELQILSGRYTFAEKHNFAHKLFPKSSDTVRKMIRFIEPKDSVSGLWEVWTFLGIDKVSGSGTTLERAYVQLALNMKFGGNLNRSLTQHT
jgi:predicted flap endonuclease-1-like 5' DNA nuclease